MLIRQRSTLWTLASSMLAMFAACADSGSVDGRIAAKSEQCEATYNVVGSRPVQLLNQQYSGIPGQMFTVVRSSRDWASIWLKICRMCAEPPPGDVDFNRDMLIVGARGEHSGAYMSSVDGVKLVGGQLEIVILEYVAGPQCLITTANMQPVSVARVPKSICPPRFRPVAEEHNCQV
jgi:hypothetical protein